MKKLLTPLCVIPVVLIAIACGAMSRQDQTPPDWSAVKGGDVLFQRLDSPQTEALTLATGSPYTHCGVAFWKDGALFVLEAVGPVKVTPIDEWAAREARPPARMVVMRLKDESVLTSEALKKLEAAGRSMIGAPYDFLFQWSDEAIYCSELVWKIYKEALGVDLAPLRSFSDYDLDHEAVRALMRERYGDAPPPDELVVAPSDLMLSPYLETVAR